MKLILAYYFLKNLLKNMVIRKPPDKIHEIQFNKLKKLLRFAYRNNKYYRELFEKNNLTPDSFRVLEDITKFPVSDRADITNSFPDKIVSSGFKLGKNCFLVSTSGSTGVPIKVYKSYDTIFSTISLGSKRFMKKIFDIDKITIMTILVYAPETIEQVISDFALKSRRVPFRKINALDDVEVYIENLNQFKPEILFTYPSVLKDIKLYLNSSGERIHSPKIIFTSGEIFEKEIRKEILNLFPGSRIVDTYFCTEAGLIASNCAVSDKMHVLKDRVYLEILDKNGVPV
ncbi:MAG TPA: phenylacetate--CoA ligase family protein, partial [Firmicutes bacterium]|nr:phenylacetate--CoA ligase family protein [Bacillota bacterium]